MSRGRCIALTPDGLPESAHSKRLLTELALHFLQSETQTEVILQLGFDERCQPTTARPFAESRTCRWPGTKPWLVSTSSGVREGT
jgi:hypothetical protein